MSKIVVALGGNALGNNPEEQKEKVSLATKVLAKLIKEGNEVVITHGNGPQIGQISLAMEYAANGDAGTPYMPFPECGSMSQGYIGYHLQQSLQDELKKQNINKNCVTLVTQTLVDKNDEAFNNPSKPIGMFYSKEQSEIIAKEKGYIFTEDAGRGYRRVVPSPLPIKIVEEDAIKQLVTSGNVVIAVGGGGIPVMQSEDNSLKGVEAVIDKDRSAALLAKEIGADILLILTAVEKVYIHFNTENQQELNEITVSQAKEYMENGEFAKGSMLPKVDACLNFVAGNEGKAIITSLEKAYEALTGQTGTIIKEG